MTDRSASTTTDQPVHVSARLWLPRLGVDVVHALAVEASTMPDIIRAAVARVQSAQQMPGTEIPVSISDLTLLFTEYSMLDNDSRVQIAELVALRVDGITSTDDITAALTEIAAINAA